MSKLTHADGTTSINAATIHDELLSPALNFRSQNSRQMIDLLQLPAPILLLQIATGLLKIFFLNLHL